MNLDAVKVYWLGLPGRDWQSNRRVFERFPNSNISMHEFGFEVQRRNFLKRSREENATKQKQVRREERGVDDLNVSHCCSRHGSVSSSLRCKE